MIGTLRKLQKLISKFSSEARAPHSPQHSTIKARAPHSPPVQYWQSQGSPQPSSTVPAKQGLPIAPQDHHRDCLPLSSTRKSSQPPGTITGTACLSSAPEEAPSHWGPPQGLPVISEHSLDIYTFKLETS